MNKKGERDVGENNCAFQFRNGKAKSLVIYLDAFKKSIQDNMINSESYKLWLRPVMLYHPLIYIYIYIYIGIINLENYACS